MLRKYQTVVEGDQSIDDNANRPRTRTLDSCQFKPDGTVWSIIPLRTSLTRAVYYRSWRRTTGWYRGTANKPVDVVDLLTTGRTSSISLALTVKSITTNRVVR